MSIEALVFDIGNVLVPFDWQPFHRRLEADCTNLTTGAEKEFRDLVIGIEVGEMTGEMFTTLAVRTIGFQGDENEFLSIWNGIFQFESTDGTNDHGSKGAIPPLFALEHLGSSSRISTSEF